MRIIRFSLYYFFKLISVRLGVHQTSNPLELKWRWNYWRKKDEKRRERKALYELNKPTSLKRRFQ